MATEIALIRHGHAVRINGDYIKAPLTEIGQQQAQATGNFFFPPAHKLAALYTSPLRRTRETAEAIGTLLGLPISEQLGVQEVRNRELPILVALEFLSLFDPVEDYLDRHVGQAINWPIEGRVSKVILELVAKHPDSKVGVVTHSGIISSVLSWCLPEERWKWWRYTVGNCSITKVLFTGQQVKVLAIDDTTHLNSEIETTQPPAPAVEAVESVHPISKTL